MVKIEKQQTKRLVVDEEIHHQLKIKAIMEKKKMQDLVNDFLREKLNSKNGDEIKHG